MKKILLLGVMFMLFKHTTIAQPVLTSSTSPTATTSIVLQRVQPVSYTATGASHTWDFSTVVDNGSPSTINYISPSATPYASSFPTSNVANATASGTTYLYIKTSATKFENLGIASSTYGVLPYSNPESFQVYPLNFNTLVSDNWAATLTYAPPTTFFRKGITTNIMDGYGTVITPAGTFNDVMRIKTTQTYYDSMVVSGTFVSFIDYTYTVYNWYVNGSATPVFQVAESLYTDGSASTSPSYAYGKNVSVGIENNNSENVFSMNVYPNPSTNYINIEVPSNNLSNAQIQLIDCKGAIVMQIPFTNSNSPIDISSFEKGIYTLILSDESGIVASRKISKN